MPPPVILPDRLDPMTRAQLAQVVEARDSGTPIRSSRSIEKVCDVSTPRAVVLWNLWREVSPFVFGRHNPEPAPQDPVAIPVAVTDQQAADEEQDHAAALASADREVVITRNEAVIPAVIHRADSASVSIPLTTPPPDSVILVDLTGERVTLHRRQEPTHAEPIPKPAAEVPSLQLDRDASGTSAGVEPATEVRGHLVPREPRHLPSVAGGDPPDVLPGLRAPAQVKGKGGKVAVIDDPRWHRCADALARILAVHGGARALAAGIQPSGGRGKIIADTAPKAGWDRYAARLEAVADACEGAPDALVTAAAIHAALADPSSRLTVDGLLWKDGAKLVGALDAALSQPEAADRVSDLRPVVRVAGADRGRRDDADRSVTAEDVRAVLARRGYRSRDEIVGEVADG